VDSIFRGSLDGRRGRWLAWLDSLFIDHALLRLVWTNLHTVLPGRLYRSNHPTPGRLARLARRLGLKSVVNLRGPTQSGSDALLRESASRLGLVLLDAPLSSRSPEREDLLRLIRILREAEEPVLLHCKSGADRSGFAAALYLILREGMPVARARRQLSWRFGHWRGGASGILDLILERYAEEGEGRTDLEAWVAARYDRPSFTALQQGRSRRLLRLLDDRVLRRE
jgi:protein tyrosine/serine phosphatase